MIVIDTIGDLVFRRWKSMVQVEKCEHCGKELEIKLELNDVSYGHLQKALDKYEEEVI